MQTPFSLHDITLSFPNKICFEDFSTRVYAGQRIALIGRNGCGKSSLLDIVRGALTPTSGEVQRAPHMMIGYVEQTIGAFDTLSGGQRLNKRFSEALGTQPDVLLLDEPTNHLDRDNRQSLINMLKRFSGTLLIASHDIELLRTCIDTFWHIDEGKIHVFTGSYDDYMRERHHARLTLEKKLCSLKRDQQEMHASLMQEQKRAAKSKKGGQKKIMQRKWPTIVSRAKAHRAECATGRKKAQIEEKKDALLGELAHIRLPEVLTPKFHLTPSSQTTNAILSVTEGSVGYIKDTPILRDLSFSLGGQERIAIVGKNASGKSTFLKGLLGAPSLFKSGTWHTPNQAAIGYLDQHYATLDPKLSLMEHLQKLRPDWHAPEIRCHLNAFLFRKNEDVQTPTEHFSGGEKARACLSMIAARPPKLLILDEVTNNLDLETKAHVTQILTAYPGAMIVVSHEKTFLQDLQIDQTYVIENGALKLGHAPSH